MRLVVVGTDTGVGKTVVAAALARARARRGHAVRYWKPLSTGPERDAVTVASTGLTVIPELYALAEPIAPHLAAAREGVTLDPATLRAALPDDAELVVEGVGGVLVPIAADGTLFADLMVSWRLPAVVVARTALGTMSHTLLTLEALRLRGVEVLGVVLSGPPAPGLVQTIEQFGRTRVLAELPWVDDPHALALELPDDVQADLAQEHAGAPAWLAADRAHVWRPYTAQKHAPPPLSVVSAHRASLELADGRRLIDASASWWVNAHGHTHPRLVRALAAQAARLDQVIYAACAHEPGARLAEALVHVVPGSLPRVFYSDDGSTAVEVAIKIAFQSWKNRGVVGRTRLVALEGAYHGDTFGAMSAGGDGVFHAAFRELLFDVVHVRVPGGDARLPTLEEVLSSQGEQVFAVIVEPMVQGAAGMRIHPASFLAEARRLTAEHGVPLIADEVFTGFGRTGRMFACEHAGVVPDLLCLSKALTGGLLPLGATLASQALYDTFVSDDRRHTLFHGHSFTGNPLACAVALESLALFADEDTLAHIAALEARARLHLARLERHPSVRRTRALGAVWALDLVTAGEGGYLDPIGARVVADMLEAGVAMRPLGPVLYVVPPYALTLDEVDHLFDALDRALARHS